MGGGGTWHLGLKYPQLWAALAPIAPAIFEFFNARKRKDPAPAEKDAEKRLPTGLGPLQPVTSGAI